ncbi:bifunctional diaminohydroxyphosphoribosylaminopyrimidine deaminase/5-amino-6-(5-phosphoribosylamino)uracil reductase RibD [Candidatus Endowatersipora endosymbiont of Watersipora subatra]|uniref:bifunctional diaminohydroxyphosphoribosylaminopyrimidine deaminase/5-amino-6-(5-phosphoribosylamino)uracil reductase RibD n=1 Tax=Candidatus Endowatersipora endosymbiont of Watersipora subatra TaxID=3077946 RepID=UPI00312CAE53
MNYDYDHKLMAACLRYARRHRGLTASNPSVGTLLVHFGTDGPRIVGRGVTAIGGRPHAERIAIDCAGELAIGSTAYVTLEPCAHHASTPPCAQALIHAGVSRVVTACSDPDERVNGRGHKMLQDAGIVTQTGLFRKNASEDLSGYFSRQLKRRPHVVLKLAVSSDGWLGIKGKEILITGRLARYYGHRMRAETDSILVGRGTVEADDPLLTCRLPGLRNRSPRRFVLDQKGRLPVGSQLVRTACTVPVTLITSWKYVLSNRLYYSGVRTISAEIIEDGLALFEVLEDIAAQGVSSLMVEGGAQVAESFLKADLVDEIALFTSKKSLKEGDIPSPLTQKKISKKFQLRRSLNLGDDRLTQFFRA